MDTTILRPVPNATMVAKALAIVAVAPCGLLIGGEIRHLLVGGPLLPGSHDMWLVIHPVAVIPSLPLGAFVLLARKGDQLHRLLGRVWIALMLTVALSSYGLRDEGGRFSFIHILSVAMLIGLPMGLYQAMKGRLNQHCWTMTRLYAALIIAGLSPTRTLGAWVFG